MFSLLVLCIGLKAHGQLVSQKLDSIVASKRATVGLSVHILETGDTISMNGSRHFPMQSVYKFHLALAVLNMVDKGKLRLDKMIFLNKRDLPTGTHSPLRDRYPKGNISVSIDELLRYTVGQSDNNGCDILFKVLGGTKVVDQYIKKIGIRDVAIVGTEAQMHADEKMQFKNYSSPKAATEVLLQFVQGKILEAGTTEYLMKNMQESSSGPNKLKGLLPSGTVVAHKTGYSGSNDEGVTYATNDIGIVTLPNGNHMLISAFVMMSKETEVVNDRLIAELTKIAFDKYGGI
jgi:beta-lactamase class A